MRTSALHLLCRRISTQYGLRSRLISKGYATACGKPEEVPPTATKQTGPSDEEILKNVKFPVKGLVSKSLLFGAGCAGVGMGIGSTVLGGVVPFGVAVSSVLPIAAGMCVMDPRMVEMRALVVSGACLPIGISCSSLLSMASWPVVGTAALVVGPALAAGYSAFHVSETEGNDLELISLPDSPLTKMLYRIGLWNRMTPWAHKSFRDVFKLFFYYSALSSIPTFWAMYGGWEVWLNCYWVWQWSFTFGITTMLFGCWCSNADTLLSPDTQARFPRLAYQLRPIGQWLTTNHLTNAAWIYGFYMLPVAVLFLLWYKWKHGVSASPFDDNAPRGGGGGAKGRVPQLNLGQNM